MKRVSLELNNSLFDEFIVWLNSHKSTNFKINEIQDIDESCDEFGVNFVTIEEQKEIIESLKDEECYIESHRKSFVI